MSNLAAFASLLQLGFGIGIGLSVFRSPLTLRATSLGKRLDAELSIIKDSHSTKANELRGKLSSAKLLYHDAMREMERSYVPLMGAVLIGALANMSGLILASLYPDVVVNESLSGVLLFISTGYYLFVALVIEIYTRYRMRAVYSALAGIL
ncbi:hypothetical protein [Devosia salina]|uniref:DUF2721 domain-containing protein n=1 Tax=Devosia salina TaxID=2860336 RepID=A0ABX8WI68_9HYPH|nr:hypothetical protein [Devosia salina]QYO77192.1 hypothetical protein K1X15_00875 [Devosia salina]